MADQPTAAPPDETKPAETKPEPPPRRVTRRIPMSLVQNINASIDALSGEQRTALTGAIERHLHAARAIAELLTLNALSAPLAPAPPAPGGVTAPAGSEPIPAPVAGA